MSTKKLKGKYLSQYFLILSCLTLCLSACIKISGEITCEKCESGKITILVSDCNLNRIAEKTLDNCGPYSILIPPTYFGEKLDVLVHCDEDNDDAFSIGDRLSFGQWFELQETNEVNIDINKEITATIEGKVGCVPYTDGPIYIYVFDGSPYVELSPSYIGGPFNIPMNLNENTSYKVFITNTSLGSEVWILGHWDKDESGVVCESPNVNECDYIGGPVDNEGKPISITLNNEEMTGIDFDLCQSQIQPCFE